MKRIFLIFFLLSGCTNNKTEKSNNLSNIIFSDNLSFEEFKIKLDEYAINNPYPNLND